MAVGEISKKEERVEESNENTIGKTYRDAASLWNVGVCDHVLFKLGLFKCLPCVLLWAMR